MLTLRLVVGDFGEPFLLSHANCVGLLNQVEARTQITVPQKSVEVPQLRFLGLRNALFDS